MKIVAIESREHPRVVDVWEASVRATHDFLSEEDIVRLKALVPGYLGMVKLFGARDEHGAIIAFLGVIEGNVEMLFIHPSHRGRGIGRAFMQYAAHNLGADTVDVNEENDQAVGFYRRIGFEVFARSERDAQGEPHPLLHMRLKHPDKLGDGGLRHDTE